MRIRIPSLAMIALAFVACENPEGPGLTGSIDMDVSAVFEATVSQVPLDSVLVVVQGPENWSIVVTESGRVTSGPLPPGDYDIALVGIIDGVIDAFSSDGVTVVAGGNTEAQFVWSDFFTTLDPVVSPTVDSDLQVSWSPVQHAEGYVLEWDTDPGFSAPSKSTPTDPTAIIPFGGVGDFTVRVRATNSTFAPLLLGTPSAPVAVAVIDTPVVVFPNPLADVDIDQVMSPIDVEIRDGVGNPIVGFDRPVVISITSGTGTPSAVLSGTVDRVSADGVVTFDDLSVSAEGIGYTLTATVDGAWTGESQPFDVLARFPFLSFTAFSGNSKVGVPFAFVQITAFLSEGIIDSLFDGQVTVDLASGGTPGASLLGTKTVSAVNGVANFGDLSVDSVGVGYVLMGSATGFQNALSTAFDITPASAPDSVASIDPVRRPLGTARQPQY